MGKPAQTEGNSERMEKEIQMNGTNRVIAIVKLAADFGTFFAMVFVGIQTCTLKQQVALQFLTTRPFVYLAPGADINSGTTFYRVVNRSAIPARIISKDLKGWVNGQKLPTLPESEDKFTQMIVTGDEGVALPGVRIESFGPEPKAYSEAFKLLRSGKHCLETAACIIYESIDSTDVRPGSSLLDIL